MNFVEAPNGWLCPEDPGEPGLGHQRWSVNDQEARIVSELCRSLDVLEIGTGLGVSTREIAKQARQVFTVDVDCWVEDNIAPGLPSNCHFFTDIQYVPRPLDAAFVDGLHSYEQCTLDIAEAKRIVKPKGMIIFHDANMQSVMKAIVESGLKPTLILTWAGIALTWNE